MLYTRKGDGGETGLFGTKERLPKDSAIFEALGSVDELNSFIGICFVVAQEETRTTAFDVPEAVRSIQENLFIVQAEIAGAEKELTQTNVDASESTIAQLEALIERPKGFVIAGTTNLSAHLDYARAMSRRTERRVISVGPDVVSEATRRYLNRLSSFLYVLARYAASVSGEKESSPSY